MVPVRARWKARGEGQGRDTVGSATNVVCGATRRWRRRRGRGGGGEDAAAEVQWTG